MKCQKIVKDIGKINILMNWHLEIVFYFKNSQSVINIRPKHDGCARLRSLYLTVFSFFASLCIFFFATCLIFCWIYPQKSLELLWDLEIFECWRVNSGSQLTRLHLRPSREISVRTPNSPSAKLFTLIKVFASAPSCEQMIKDSLWLPPSSPQMLVNELDQQINSLHSEFVEKFSNNSVELHVVCLKWHLCVWMCIQVLMSVTELYYFI